MKNLIVFHTICPTDLLDLSPAPNLKNFPGISDLQFQVTNFSFIQIYAPKVAIYLFLV